MKTSPKWLPLKEEDGDVPALRTWLPAGTFQVLVDPACVVSTVRQRAPRQTPLLTPPQTPRFAESLAEQKQLTTPWVSPLSLTKQQLTKLHEFTLVLWVSGLSVVSCKPLKWSNRCYWRRAFCVWGCLHFQGSTNSTWRRAPLPYKGPPLGGDQYHSGGFQGWEWAERGLGGKAGGQWMGTMNRKLLVSFAGWEGERDTPRDFRTVCDNVRARPPPQDDETNTDCTIWNTGRWSSHYTHYFFLFLYTDESVFDTNFWISSHHF